MAPGTDSCLLTDASLFIHDMFRFELAYSNLRYSVFGLCPEPSIKPDFTRHLLVRSLVSLSTQPRPLPMDFRYYNYLFTSFDWQA